VRVMVIASALHQHQHQMEHYGPSAVTGSHHRGPVRPGQDNGVAECPGVVAGTGLGGGRQLRSQGR
jgi:hypothetical protein